MFSFSESIIGFITGDALGVPVEFIPRVDLMVNPVIGLREYEVHNQPQGTWSDDTSMLLCTVESILKADLDLTDLAKRFISWKNEGY